MRIIPRPNQLIRLLSSSSRHPVNLNTPNRTLAIYNPPATTSSTPQPIAVRLGSPGPTGGQQGGGQGGALGFPATYNELPIPSGEWEKMYSQQQQKYNKHLIVGLSMFCVTVFTLNRLIDFNMSPPPLEDEEEDEFCAVKVEVKKCEEK